VWKAKFLLENKSNSPTAAAIEQPLPPVDKYRPVTGRKRVMLAVMAVIVACTVIPYMVRHYGMVRAFQAAQDAAQTVPVCRAGQTAGCVGGTVQIIITPPKPPTPAASR
jgi:hypothetical protein